MPAPAIRLPALIAILLLAVSGHTSAQGAKSKSATHPAPKHGAARSAAKDEAPSPQPGAANADLPDARTVSILIRRTLLSLNDANLSGNYTVLRDLAAPGFQATNDAARLTDIFTVLRRRKVDLAPIVYFEPKLVRPAEINESGMLRLSGFIPTRPEQVNFDMLFQKIGGRWRLFGIAVNTTQAQLDTPTLKPPEPDTTSVAKPKPKASGNKK
jgi:hypothetical protein